ncbi:MAG: hypothetical protein JWQ92_1978 [Amnibacterium sp.]|nr:hypothetical protein [Amnibacterium sp.]
MVSVSADAGQARTVEPGSVAAAPGPVEGAALPARRGEPAVR